MNRKIVALKNSDFWIEIRVFTYFDILNVNSEEVLCSDSDKE